MSRGVGQARVAKLQWKGNCRFWATYTRHFIHNLAVACVQYCSFLFGLFNFLNPQFCEAGVNLTDDAIRVRMGPCIKLFDVIAQLCTAEGGLDSMRICRTAGPKLAHFGCIYLCVCVCVFFGCSAGMAYCRKAQCGRIGMLVGHHFFHAPTSVGQLCANYDSFVLSQ